jgi:hypothetical protein
MNEVVGRAGGMSLDGQSEVGVWTSEKIRHVGQVLCTRG